MPYETIRCDKEDGIIMITLDRSERLNAINLKLCQELKQALDEVALDNEVRVVIITGGDRAFSAGIDIKEIMETPNISFESLLSNNLAPIFDSIEKLEKPVIAAISGSAVGGGCELALACDLRLASTTATFGLPEVKIGAIPACGGTVRLPRLIGIAKAKEMLFLGDFIDAQEAYHIGLVNKVVSTDSLLAEARQLAKTLLQRPPLALKAIKFCVNFGMQMSHSAALACETREAALLHETEDRIEGMKAFLEKKKPVFKGR
jgi:enoyl-CoA hydratase